MKNLFYVLFAEAIFINAFDEEGFEGLKQAVEDNPDTLFSSNCYDDSTNPRQIINDAMGWDNWVEIDEETYNYLLNLEAEITL